MIELLIVVLILGILAGVVMFALGTFTSKSAVAACQTDVKTVQTAVAAYYVTNGAYPTSDGGSDHGDEYSRAAGRRAIPARVALEYPLLHDHPRRNYYWNYYWYYIRSRRNGYGSGPLLGRSRERRQCWCLHWSISRS